MGIGLWVSILLIRMHKIAQKNDQLGILWRTERILDGINITGPLSASLGTYLIRLSVLLTPAGTVLIMLTLI